MKKISVFLIFAVLCANSFAQSAEEKKDDEKKGGFKKENLFAGGNVALGFGSGSTSFGLGPYFGYSINKYVDVALSLNYNYISQRDFLELGDKVRQSIIGPGIFTRLYPVKFLFAHAQFEQNYIKFKYIPAPNGNYLSTTERKSATSFLVGPGYASGRGEGSSFYYISVLFDVTKNKNSPYVDALGRVNPVIRAGFNISLFQGKEIRKSDNRRMY